MPPVRQTPETHHKGSSCTGEVVSIDWHRGRMQDMKELIKDAYVEGFLTAMVHRHMTAESTWPDSEAKRRMEEGRHG